MAVRPKTATHLAAESITGSSRERGLVSDAFSQSACASYAVAKLSSNTLERSSLGEAGSGAGWSHTLIGS